MRRITGRLASSGAILLLMLACNPEKQVGPGSQVRAFDAAETPVATLVLHVVAPQTTDVAIDQALDDHYAWLDTTVQSNHTLLVFLPGTGQRPAMFQLVQQEAARLGYHVIGLMYVNGGGFARNCPIAPDPASCYEEGRLEVIDGIDRVPFLTVNQSNSIDNRLTKLLEYLDAQYPSEGWAPFLVHGTPKWPLIAVAGHSQGGGEAAMIGKIRLVARVVMFSSVTDSIGKEAPPWVATHVTPLNRYWGIAHDRDAFYPSIRAAWDSIGLTAFGPPVTPETSQPPYSWTRMLVTDVTPVGGFVGTNAHGSPSNDANTPLLADGTPLLRDAWDYLLTGLPRRPGQGVEVSRWGAPR